MGFGGAAPNKQIADVLTSALLAAFVPNSAQKWLYREKYYTESAEGRQMAQGVRL